MRCTTWCFITTALLQLLQVLLLWCTYLNTCCHTTVWGPAAGSKLLLLLLLLAVLVMQLLVVVVRIIYR
jgi:hypothetical protein